MTNEAIKKVARPIVAAHARADDPHGDRQYADTAIDQRVAGWRSAAPSSDWEPDGADQWVGGAERHPEGVAIGVPTGDPQTPGIQGVVAALTGASNTGLVVVGYVDQATVRAPDLGVQANAPLELAGSPVLLTGPVYVEVSQALTEDRYLLLGASSQQADGRHMAPLLAGPQYLPAQLETAIDTRDISLDGVDTPELVVSLTLANAYAAIASSFAYEVRLSEEGGRDTDFTVEVWVNEGAGFQLVLSDHYRLAGQALNVSYSTPITTPAAAGDIIELRVSALGSNPNADPWVRGATRASELTMRQG